MSNPEAYYDVLHLGDRISDLIDGFSRSELHLFSYASCLLSLYEGHPSAEWGYDFVCTEYGLPFSKDLDAALDDCISLAQIEFVGNILAITSTGSEELTMLSDWQGNMFRSRYLSGAVDALLVFNPGNIREAFNYDSTISYMKQGKHTNWLLTEPVVDRLYKNFQQIRSTLGQDVRDLTVPFVSWLRYLLQEGRV